MAFVGLDRGIIDHWIFQDAEYFKVWFAMIHRARYSKEPHTELVEGELVVINYGEFIYGRLKWSERLKVSEQRLRTLLKKLKAADMIEPVLEHRKFTLYRIKNYEKYNQQSNQQEGLIDQGVSGDSNQQSNQQLTSSQPAANQQPTTKEQRKKENKETSIDNYIGADAPKRTKFIQPTFEEVKAYCEERGKGVDPARWYDHYTANGWMVGKTKMKDWKAAVRTWEKNIKQYPTVSAKQSKAAANNSFLMNKINRGEQFEPRRIDVTPNQSLLGLSE